MLYSRTSIATVHVIGHSFYRGKLCTLGIYAGSKLKNFPQPSIIAVIEHVALLLCSKLYKCVIN